METKQEMVSPFVYPGLSQEGLLKLLKREPDEILNKVCKYFKANPDDVTSKSRRRELVEVRYICISLIKNYTNLTLFKIGRIFDRDHSTIIHAINTVNDLSETDREFKEKVKGAEKVLFRS